MSMDKTQKELLSSFFEITNARFERCLEPLMQCQKQAIRAHSVQNSRALDLLARNGHVIGFTKRIDHEKGPVIDFGKIGRNAATTFTGLCAEHDRAIFEPIDTKELDVSDTVHLFLLAYRAVIRELHATMEAAVKIQSGYEKRVDLGLSPGDRPSPDGTFAVERMIVSHETFRYRVNNYDRAFLDGSFDSLTHDVFVFENQRPVLAACTLFSLDEQRVGDDIARVAINILPRNENETVVLFSYAKKDAPVARSVLSRVLDAGGEHQKYEISRILLNYCENFVIAPSNFETWTDKKREAIRDYFARTIFRREPEFEDSELMLF